MYVEWTGKTKLGGGNGGVYVGVCGLVTFPSYVSMYIYLTVSSALGVGADFAGCTSTWIIG